MNQAPRQELAEIGRPSDGAELQGDERLFHALLSGCHIENAGSARRHRLAGSASTAPVPPIQTVIRASRRPK